MTGRQYVIWLGQPPAACADAETKLRRLVLEAHTKMGLDALHPTFAKARGLILSVSGAGDALLDRAKTSLIAQAYSHGLSVWLHSPLEAVDEVTKRFHEWDHWLQPTAVTDSGIPNALNAILDHQPGPSFNKSVKLVGDLNHIDEEEKLLLQRAFSDAVEVKLSILNGGSSAKVFQAFANLRDSRIGLQPLPFFVKLDRRAKIMRELENYNNCTTLFVPFYARPNLDSSRCASGYDRGILVGNFVEFSRSLSELICDGTSSRAIHSLFEDALRGWRRQAFIDASKSVTAPLARSFRGAVYSNSVTNGGQRAERVAASGKAFGARRSAAELASAIDCLPPIPHRWALAHGDLHADNVRVRDGQAILIDFASTGNAPLSADPAALDTSLILQSNEIDEQVWKTFVDEFYSVEAVRVLPAPGPAGAPMAGLRDAVRDIRRFGLADRLHVDEYAQAVAIYLLRHAYRQPRADEPRDRRAYLFAAADKLVTALL